MHYPGIQRQENNGNNSGTCLLLDCYVFCIIIIIIIIIIHGNNTVLPVCRPITARKMYHHYHSLSHTPLFVIAISYKMQDMQYMNNI